MQEKIKWFNDENGYGYIEYTENGSVIIRFYNKDNSNSFELTLNRDDYNTKEKTG